MDVPPVLRLILCGFVMGIGGGLFNGIKKHKSAVPSVLQKTCYVVGAILEFAPLLIVLPSLFDCLGKGLGNLHGNGLSTHYVDGKEQFKLADFVMVTVRKDFLKKENIPAKPEFTEKW